MTNLRQEFSGLTAPSAQSSTYLGHVVDQITDVPVRVGVTRNVFIEPETATQQLPVAVAQVLVHVGGEALTNAMLHVQVKASGSEIELFIADDGQGSSVLALGVDQLRPNGHFGLASMYRRAAKVNGHLEITSEPQSGTTMRLRVPRTW